MTAPDPVVAEACAAVDLKDWGDNTVDHRRVPFGYRCARPNSRHGMKQACWVVPTWWNLLARHRFAIRSRRRAHVRRPRRARRVRASRGMALGGRLWKGSERRRRRTSMTEPKGSLMTYPALNCGHPVRCYSLEPTPTLCHDCANNDRKELVRIVDDIRDIRIEDVIGVDEIDEYMDEQGIRDPEMRKDITAIAERCEDIFIAIDSAEQFAKKILAKYPEVKVGNA